MTNRIAGAYTKALQTLEQHKLSGNGVSEAQQNLLFLLESNHLGPGRTELADHLASTLDKVPLLLGMGDDERTRPYRSETRLLLTQPGRNEYNDTQWQRAKQRQMTETIADMLNRHQTAYIKEQGVLGTRGQGVYRVYRQDDELLAQVQRSKIPLQQLLESMTQNFCGASLIEGGHKLHQTERGNTWELRCVPMTDATYLMVKEAANGEYRNNISCGGSWHDARAFVHGQLGPDADTFLQGCAQIMQRVKAYTDARQVAAAKVLFPSTEFKDGHDYESLMNCCFSGTFAVVDIAAAQTPAGIAPVVIETQFEGSIPDQFIAEATLNATVALQAKLDCVKAAL